ncbi:MAG: glycosyl hydrolase 115 family protein [Opitutales bacterium]|nr:glycosyl hydrolase 115 family protein [Opitutales bacterium]
MTVLYAILFSIFITSPSALLANLGETNPIQFTPSENSLVLVKDLKAAPIIAEDTDWAGVLRAAADLPQDFNRVASIFPELRCNLPQKADAIILVGTIGKSQLIDSLVKDGKIDISKVKGEWESWVTTTVKNPFPGIKEAVVIAGSDKRGTIYGIYNLSQQIGVSPWYWWADVTPVKRSEIYFTRGTYLQGPPAVKYRGFFINDEAPALTGWTQEKFGGINSKFYAHVFELLLRLRANYIWPAMWCNAFNTDDPECPRLADEYGIVMGTSHHEPMMRSQKEWQRYGKGHWNYENNEEVLKEFWRYGIHRNRHYENMTTIGMRGDGDMAMSETANISLLEKIVADQRDILVEETGKKIEDIPQMWALYKEVQEYYEKGMRVPDDVTLLWCDDNYGNIRRLPSSEEQKRSGGAGIYYHVDYVGWPRCYKWLNTSSITKIWEQMQMAWKYKADRIWIVNVGDIKPMEFPIEFFMTYAWSPEKWPYEKLDDYTRLWAEREFGKEHAQEIADIISSYTKLNSSAKPEFISTDTFSLINYDEAKKIADQWDNLISQAEAIYEEISYQKKDAFFQLVLWQVKASGIVNKLYIEAAYNNLYAFQNRAETNSTADRTRELFGEDAALTQQYNEELSNGKWNHFADQTHIGYTTWQQPALNTMPAVSEIHPKTNGDIGVAIEGMKPAWPEVIPGMKSPTLPAIDSLGNQSRWIEVFNRGNKPTSYKAYTEAPWLKLSPASGEIDSTTRRITVTVDWNLAPIGEKTEMINVVGSNGTRVRIKVPVINYGKQTPQNNCFLESEKYVCIDAPHYSRAITDNEIEWKTLEGYGKTLGGVKPFPVEAESRKLSQKSPRLEYDFYSVSSGKANIELYLSTTLAFNPDHGLRLAVSVDDGEPKIIDLKIPAGDGQEAWGKTVYEAVRKASISYDIENPGNHTLKIWMIDPAILIQRVILSFDEIRDSYFGPPESPYHSK